MIENASKQYMVLFRLGRTDVQRLSLMIPRLQAHLRTLAVGPIEQVIRSASADLITYFLRSRLGPRQIMAAIETPMKSYMDEVSPILAGDDAVFILEIGESYAASQSFSRAETWLQRH